MAQRPAWKGYLKLSLVSCSVAMYTATSTSSRIRLSIVNRETGNRIRNQAIDSETGDAVENDAKRAGKAPPASPSPHPSNVINLMDALRRSVRGDKATGGKATLRAKPKRTTGSKKKTAKHKRLKRAS